MTQGRASQSNSNGGDSSHNPDEFHSLWVPWPSVGNKGTNVTTEASGSPIEDIHLHRYCDVSPFSELNIDAEPRFTFVEGTLRTGLRFTPLIIFGVVVITIAFGELSASVQGIGALLPQFEPYVIPMGVGVVVLWGGLFALASRVDLFDGRDLMAAGLVFGLIGVLIAGTGYSIYAVLTAQDPSTLPPNIVFLSGYLLMLLIGGLLVYDGMLRTEYMLENFGEWDHSIVPKGKEDQYETWLSALDYDLSDELYEIELFDHSIPLQTSHVFAALFILQFGALWVVTAGPQNLDSNYTLGLNLFLDFFIVVIAFHFLILIKYFHELVSDSYDPEESTEEPDAPDDSIEEPDNQLITYEPFHIDHHGGFKDFGRFATRVNVLLLLGGSYTLYRLIVQGLRVLPTTGISGFGSEAALLFWIANYVGPILAYGIAAVAWGYYSFWAMHRKMVLDKQTRFLEDQGLKHGPVEPAAIGDEVDEFNDSPDFTYLRSAPEWPINSRWLVSLASANMAPVVLPILQFF